MHRIVEISESSWAPALAEGRTGELASALELGKVIHLPRLPFVVARDELRFLDPSWLSGTHKSVSFDPARSDVDCGLRGARGEAFELKLLATMLGRFRASALSLVRALFPAYGAHLRMAPTSLRPGNVERHKLSWRKDDTLLHVDAFPSRPNRGERILRVFCNVNPDGVPRVWKVGGLFEETVQEFLPRITDPLPGSATLLRMLRVTKLKRSRYDHIMLAMHDRMKEDAAYQQRASHLVFSFPPGSTWICFSDQTAHAALSGQFMLEQTLHLPTSALYFPQRSPLKVLERARGRALA